MKINIGTNKGNIVGAEIDKPFDEITITDVFQIITEKYGTTGNSIIGWCPTSENLNLNQT